MNITNPKHISFIALYLAIIIHLILLFFSTQIFFKNKIKKSDSNFIKLNVIKHNIDTKESNSKKINKQKKSISTTSNIYQKFDKKEKRVFNEPILKSYTDTLASEIKAKQTRSNTDSFLIQNPNITVLKLASKEKLKNYVSKKSFLDTTKRRIKKAMSDYYKSKYPTPPYKFGERGTGNLINIPVEDVINLFKGK